MTSSLEKFRAQYPEGCLSADLVSVHDGQYIVRAVVSNGGVPLATGLAASADVQIAEDKARDRAIALLFIQPNSLTEAATPKPNEQQKPESNPAPSTAAPSPASAPESASLDEPEEDAVTLEPPDVELDPSDDSGPPLDAMTEDLDQPSAATIALENFSTSPNPVDLSDVIAQTDVELTRLGWTSVQGREYLERTYGQRSRQHLTDEELLGFLLYLEEQ